MAAGRAGRPWSLGAVPVGAGAALADRVLAAVQGGGRLLGLWGWPAEEGAVELAAVVAFDAAGRLALARGRVPQGGSFPSLTPEIPAAHAFEREIFESLGVVPQGHPWRQPLLRHAELDGRGEPMRFLRVEGDGIHEVAVGPVHAGIIEPGHFRFQCAGETVVHLDIQLGYQHRGAEALLLAGSSSRRLAVAESIAGDTAVGHALAHCELLEALAGAEVSPRAQWVRAVALELERLANHVGDLGALCNDVAYLPGASFFGRLRGEFLNLLLDLSGNRFGRGLLVPGGVRFDLDGAHCASFEQRLAVADRDLQEISELVFSQQSVLSRFEQTGVLSHAAVEQLGLSGPCARASGATRDVRADHPSGYYRFAHIPVTRLEVGDVLARALVRRVEAARSLRFLREQLAGPPAGPLRVALPALAPDSLAVALVEGWRGEIAQLGVTDPDGLLAVCKVADPSLRNWMGLALAMRGEQISDFPLCNKSFDFSYAGHDR